MRALLGTLILLLSVSVVSCENLGVRNIASTNESAEAPTTAELPIGTFATSPPAPAAPSAPAAPPATTAVPNLPKPQKHFRELEQLSAPEHRGSRLFYSIKKKDNISGLYTKTDGPKSETRLILEKPISNWHADWSGAYVAYAVLPNETEEQNAYLEVVDVESGKVDPLDHLEGMKFSLLKWFDQPSWNPRDDGFYYTAEREGHSEVRYHKLHTAQSDDKLIANETSENPGLLEVFRSRDARWEFIIKTLSPSGANEISFRAATASADTPFAPFFKLENTHSWVYASSSRFFLLTDAMAPNARVLSANSFSFPLRWRTIIPESGKFEIKYAALTGSHLLVLRVKDALTELEIFDQDGHAVRKVDLPKNSSVTDISADQYDNFAYVTIRSTGQSADASSATYRLAIPEGKLVLWTPTAESR
jgi:protease II